MTTYSLTLRREHFDQLADHLIRDDGCERAAYILCNTASIGHDPWDRQSHRKFLSAKVILVPEEQIVESTQNLITWHTASFVAALREAASREQVVCVVHSHGAGIKDFSLQDDENEPDLLQLAKNRNGDETNLLSVILTADRQLTGRIWLQGTKSGREPLRTIRITGDRMELHYPGRGGSLSAAAFQRQALAFGHALNQDLRHLRVVVIGCGGTGSAVAMLLARLGVGQLGLIDNDIVDHTNLNRLHGSRQADADAMRPKVDVVAHSIAEMGLGVRVVTNEAWVGDPSCRDMLRAADVVLSCTDDHDGRLYINRFAYYYDVPVIDIGLAIELGDETPPQLKAADGRMTVLAPGNACLLCRDVIDLDAARGEALRRSQPDEYERQKAERYVVGAGDPSPSVVTFTTELACMAVSEVIHRLQGFKGADGTAANRVRKFHLNEDRRPGQPPKSGCPICARTDVWGKGDTDPFLGRVN